MDHPHLHILKNLRRKRIRFHLLLMVLWLFVIATAYLLGKH